MVDLRFQEGVQSFDLRRERKVGQVMRWAQVTRVAFVTGLDRTGVPVACAVRPRGHILQVTHGKGETPRAAALSAVAEAAELHASERIAPSDCLSASEAELSTRGVVVMRPAPPDLRGVHLQRAWRKGEDLVTGGPVWVLATDVHCPGPQGPLLGVPGHSWTSNGLGAGLTVAAATRHALLELFERDQLARQLPSGWTPAAVDRRRLSERAQQKSAPRTETWVRKLERRGFEVHLFWVSEFPLPVAAALLFDCERGPVPLTAGYACRETLDEALLAALLEAAQSRATDIHGAREDIGPMPADQVDALREMAREAGAGRRRREGRPSKLSRPAELRALARGLATPIARVLLTRPEDPLQIVRLVAPSLQLSELL